MAKVSVIVPIYNVEKFLRQALDSVINQTLKDLEIILIDDGSTDSCPEIIQEYASKDNRIVVLKKKNGGYGQTCNMGLNRATGKYVAILEPDDFMEPEMYEDLYNLAETNDADVSKSCYYLFYDTKKLKKSIKTDWTKFCDIPKTVFTVFEFPEFISLHPSVWSALYRRDFLNEHNIRFVEAPGSGWTDNPFRAAVYCSGARIIYTDKAYYYWRNQYLKEGKTLKDFTIPYKRVSEINNWLQEHNITDENIYANLYKPVLAYARVLMGRINIKSFKIIEKEIAKLIDSINPDIFFNNTYTTKGDKKTYSAIKQNFWKYYFSCLYEGHIVAKFDSIRTDLRLFNAIRKNQNIVFWGASLYLEKFLKRYMISSKNVLGIIDLNQDVIGKNINRYKVYSPDYLTKNNTTVVMTIKHYHEKRYKDIKSAIDTKYPNAKLLPNIFEIEH